ncbi:MAG: acyl-CoA thioesterase II [Acidimicrobiia bacterium]|nr:acyl-CoA thioesterase II [Acidimicrobiia bacterium]MYG71733.1 acyl-CoA thioesterase II [Acidimicrobiia bacterium]
MQAEVDALIELLDLEPIEEDIFRGVSPQEDRQRVFGGQVAGQALVAATRTVENRSVHSLQAYFIRPGDVSAPLVYLVERVRDGRSFATRRVTAIQHGQPIFAMSASFHKQEEGFEHQTDLPTGIPDPEELEPFVWDGFPVDDQGRMIRPIELRYVTGSPAERGQNREPRLQVWLRATGTLPENPVLHTCMFTYASDMTVLDTATKALPVRGNEIDIQAASLDHAMWFHRPLRMDDWIFLDQVSNSASNARGLAWGTAWNRTGELVASVVQEGLIRPLRKQS